MDWQSILEVREGWAASWTYLQSGVEHGEHCCLHCAALITQQCNQWPGEQATAAVFADEACCVMELRRDAKPHLHACGHQNN